MSKVIRITDDIAYIRNSRSAVLVIRKGKLVAVACTGLYINSCPLIPFAVCTPSIVDSKEAFERWIGKLAMENGEFSRFFDKADISQHMSNDKFPKDLRGDVELMSKEAFISYNKIMSDAQF